MKLHTLFNNTFNRTFDGSVALSSYFSLPPEAPVVNNPPVRLKLTLKRCVTCNNSPGDSFEKCSLRYATKAAAPDFWLKKKTTEEINSYELYSSEMSSIRTGELNCKIYSGDHGTIMKTKNFIKIERDETESHMARLRQHSETPEYVKRTAKLFESVKSFDEPEMKNGVDTNKKHSTTTEERYYLETTIEERPVEGNISLDSIDGELNKKPSYLGVSCSNSGYRNVINYDSKLREGLCSNSPRESLVLCNSRLRESSPMRRDLDLNLRNGRHGESIGLTGKPKAETEGRVTSNGISQTGKFVNISTSTKTISTFRNSQDVAERKETSNGVGANVNLKQILNGESGTGRRGYSGLGFSPKILKSPEKNCNSFLRSINSFENNCRNKSEGTRSGSYSRAEQQSTSDSINSIQQRIERLYGPGALAHGFYGQKSSPRGKGMDDTESHVSDSFVEKRGDRDPNKLPISLSSLTCPPVSSAVTLHPTQNGDSIPLANSKPEVATTEKLVEPEEADDSQTEKNGLYFLKLLKKETDRLLQLATFAESELENGENLPEEINGKLRAAAGKARLLVCQKLHQFEGLCQKNMNEQPSEPFPTTSEDLAGFWDMVMLQIVQVYSVFDELEELKKNNWKVSQTKAETTSPAQTNGSQSQSQAKSTVRKSTQASGTKERTSEKAEAAKKAREETRRKMLEDRRKKMKELKENKMVSKEDEVEIFAK
ncbi:hypothetical protein RUM44_006451 [Polyplax serrata]|uniref:Disks large-associated protein 1 n=1 Tax=Polyplax serrata TaxID=468196 RepID=A0ABR1AI50_POLSC